MATRKNSGKQSSLSATAVGGLGIPTDGILTNARTGKNPSLNASTENMTPKAVNMLTNATPEQQVKMQALAQVFNEGHTLDNSTVGEIVQRVEKKVSAQAKNERQTKLAKKSKTVDNTLVAEQPGGNSPILNPHPEAEKPAKPVKPEFALFNLEDEDGHYIRNGQFTLAELVHIDKVPVKNAQLAMRDIDKQHVEHLEIAYAQGATIPPIQISMSTWGPVIVAGYHRERAMLNRLQEQMFGDLSSMSKEDKEAFSKRLAATTIDVEVVNGLTSDTIADYAFRDNLTHGRNVSDKYRSRYAVMLIQEAKAKGIELSLAQAGDMVGVSKQAVFYQLRRDAGLPRSIKAATKIAADLVVAEEDKIDLDRYFLANDQKQSADRLRKASKMLITAMLTVYDEGLDTAELVEYFSKEILPTVQVNAATFNLASDTVLSALASVQLMDEEETEE